MMIKVPLDKGTQTLDVRTDRYVVVELNNGKSFVMREVEAGDQTLLEICSMDLDDDTCVLLE